MREAIRSKELTSTLFEVKKIHCDNCYTGSRLKKLGNSITHIIHWQCTAASKAV